MDITTLIGLIIGFIFIIGGIVTSGDFLNFLDFPSFLIVFGGTISAIIISTPWENLKESLVMLKIVFKKDDAKNEKTIEDIIVLANLVRKEGLLQVEQKIDQVSDDFLKKGILQVVTGLEPEAIRNMMETELYFIENRHAERRKIYENAASVAPAFGMLGTLIGLINMLKNMKDPSSIGPQMSVALVTTFYGVILSNFIFNPIAYKLNAKTNQEILRKEIIIEGVMCIQAGDNPQIIKDKLHAFMRKKEAGDMP